MKTAIIGIGKMGNFHAKTVLNHPDFYLTGVYDIDQKKAFDFLESNKHLGYNLKAFNNIEELVLNNDAVIVSTPASTHYEVIRAILSYGNIHILCEKPLVIEENHYNRICNIKMLHEVPINVGMCERHGDLISYIQKQMLENIQEIKFTRHNTGNRNTDVNIIYDTMVHDIDLMFYLFPQIKNDTLTIDILDLSYEDNNLKSIICSLNTKTDFGKIIFDCAKGTKEMKRTCTISLKNKETIIYNFIDNIILYSTYSETIKQKEKDKLTIQLDEFLESIHMNTSLNSNNFDFENCFHLLQRIDDIVKFNKRI